MYDAYGDYDTMRVLTREIIIEAAQAAFGRPVIRRPVEGGGYEEVDISGDWPVVTLHGGISAALGTEVTPDTDRSRLLELCRQADIPFDLLERRPDHIGDVRAPVRQRLRCPPSTPTSRRTCHR